MIRKRFRLFFLVLDHVLPPARTWSFTFSHKLQLILGIMLFIKNIMLDIVLAIHIKFI